MTINECHPTWKIFRTEAEDSWAFGLYNTCYEEGAEGRKVRMIRNKFSYVKDDTLVDITMPCNIKIYLHLR